jgi:sirohydrochlorin cobaltochelatase
MSRTALILFAHGARDPEWAAPLRRVSTAARMEAPTLRVELAFLEILEPTLADCAEALVAEGYDHLIIVPMFIAQGGHLKRDLPQLVDDLRTRNPQVQFDLAGAIGEAESVVQAMARHVLRLASRARSGDQ